MMLRCHLVHGPLSQGNAALRPFTAQGRAGTSRDIETKFSPPYLKEVPLSPSSQVLAQKLLLLLSCFPRVVQTEGRERL